jgi:hypothetical protein
MKVFAVFDDEMEEVVKVYKTEESAIKYISENNQSDKWDMQRYKYDELELEE